MCSCALLLDSLLVCYLRDQRGHRIQRGRYVRRRVVGGTVPHIVSVTEQRALKGVQPAGRGRGVSLARGVGCGGEGEGASRVENNGADVARMHENRLDGLWRAL